jgi:hypothetical protein
MVISTGLARDPAALRVEAADIIVSVSTSSTLLSAGRDEKPPTQGQVKSAAMEPATLLRTLDRNARGLCAAQYAPLCRASAARRRLCNHWRIIDNPLPPI